MPSTDISRSMPHTYTLAVLTHSVTFVTDTFSCLNITAMFHTILLLTQVSYLGQDWVLHH